MDLFRKDPKGQACPVRDVASVKGKPGPMMIGASLGFINLSERACVAINPRRIELALQSWNMKPVELNRQDLSVVVCSTTQS